MDRTLSHISSTHRNKGGFTLLEVLVALAVLAIALISIYKLQGQTILMSAKSRFLTVAPHLAKAKLSEIERQESKDIADGSGDFGPDHPGYNWAVSIEEIPTELISDQNNQLIRIIINITLNEEDSYQLRSYRFYTN